MKSPVSLAAMLSSATALASPQFIPMDASMQHCYAQAMVGMDSVINSRLGVIPEHALDLSRNSIHAAPDERYWTRLLAVILDAYLWPGAPHDYAVRVFFTCASDTPPPHIQGGMEAATVMNMEPHARAAAMSRINRGPR